MRTTINIEDDLLEALKKEAAGKGRPFTEVVNHAIRAGLPDRAQAREPYRVRPFRSVLQPGIDETRMNHLAGELEDEASVRRMKESESRYGG